MTAKKIIIEVSRYRPDVDDKPWMQSFDIEWTQDMSILDALASIKDEQAADLAYRWSCRMEVCGSCGMVVNGVPTMLPLTIGTPNNGGAVTTASGLVFIAAATDDLIRAIDLRTGKTVWSASLPAGGQATPIIYQQGGREYLVIFAGGHHFMETPAGDSVIAYALPG